MAAPQSRLAPHADLEAFITSHGLDNHAGSISALLRTAHPAKWSAELTMQGIPEELLPELLEAMILSSA
jgi:hypothetical protein